MRVWRAAPDEAPAVAALLAGFCDHLGYDFPPDDSENPAAQSLYRSLGLDTGETGGQDIFTRRRL